MYLLLYHMVLVCSNDILIYIAPPLRMWRKDYMFGAALNSCDNALLQNLRCVVYVGLHDWKFAINETRQVMSFEIESVV